MLVTQKIKFDFPLCVMSERPKLLKEKNLKPVNARVFGFIYYLPKQNKYEESISTFDTYYSTLGRVYI